MSAITFVVSEFQIMQNRFSRRQVVGESLSLSRDARLLNGLAPFSPSLVPDVAVDTHLTAFVMGVDARPRSLLRDEVQGFGDAFTANVLLTGRNPLTLRALVAEVDSISGTSALPLRNLFVVGEGAHFANKFPRFDRNIRLVYTWRRNSSAPADILLSTEAVPDSESSLLQLIAWSETGGAFHFFERHREGLGWIWAGNSFHSLEAGSRGRGPFDSHINGALVMKELKEPWVHWHSMSGGIPREVAFPTEELRVDPLFVEMTGAEALEPITRVGVRRWTRNRIQSDIADGELRNMEWYARQVLWTTSVNLVSTGLLSDVLDDEAEIELPATFFYDMDAIEWLAAEMVDGASIAGLVPSARVKGGLYRQALERLDVRVEDREHGGTTVPGDTQFAFVVPERAMEDLAVIRELVTQQALSARLALTLILVDFPNPVFSPKRAALLKHFPVRCALGNSGAALDGAVISSVRATEIVNGSPEGELLSWWEASDVLGTARKRLTAYMEAVSAKLSSIDGVLDVLRLADARREAFRRRSLNEFRHTTARNGVILSMLEMSTTGTVAPKSSDLGEQEF